MYFNKFVQYSFSDGRLKPGNEILMVDGKSLVGLTHSEAVGVLKTTQQLVQLVVATEVSETGWEMENRGADVVFSLSIRRCRKTRASPVQWRQFQSGPGILRFDPHPFFPPVPRNPCLLSVLDSQRVDWSLCHRNSTLVPTNWGHFWGAYPQG